MSTIVVETIKHTNDTTLLASDTSGQLTVQGEGTATTNLQQGLSKAWINMNGTGTIAIRDSFNITSIADNATGRYTPTITNNMSSDDYAGFGGGCIHETTSNNQQTRQGPSINVQATANFQINCGSNTYAQDDWEQPTAGLLGDLA
jgi:hypothetical protein